MRIGFNRRNRGAAQRYGLIITRLILALKLVCGLFLPGAQGLQSSENDHPEINHHPDQPGGLYGPNLETSKQLTGL